MAKGEETPETLRAEIAHLKALVRGLSDAQAVEGIRKMIEERKRLLVSREKPKPE